MRAKSLDVYVTGLPLAAANGVGMVRCFKPVLSATFAAFSTYLRRGDMEIWEVAEGTR